MNSDVQSIVAGGVVVLATGFFIYSTFFKKKSGCGSEGGCGCSGIPKKPASSQKFFENKK